MNTGYTERMWGNTVKKNKTALLCVIGMLLATTACAGSTSKENLSKGMEAIELLKYEEAQTYFDAALESGEDSRQVYRAKGIAFMGANDYESALACFEEALQYGGYLPADIDVDINFYMGVCYYKCGEYDKAIERYNAILELRPKTTDAYFQRAVVELEQGKKELAKADLEKAISLDSKNYGLYIDAFSALSERGYVEEGKIYLNTAMEKGEKNMSAYDKGRLYYYLEDYTNARNFLEQARSDGNRSEEVILLLGRSYEALNDSNYALKLYEDYVAQAPNGAIYNQMGLCYCGMGEYESAIQAFEKGLSVQENSCKQQLSYNQIIAYERSSQFETAKTLIANYLKLYPDDAEAQRESAFLQSR